MDVPSTRGLSWSEPPGRVGFPPGSPPRSARRGRIVAKAGGECKRKTGEEGEGGISPRRTRRSRRRGRASERSGRRRKDLTREWGQGNGKQKGERQEGQAKIEGLGGEWERERRKTKRSSRIIVGRMMGEARQNLGLNHFAVNHFAEAVRRFPGRGSSRRGKGW